jgi:hypothetical protein
LAQAFTELEYTYVESEDGFFAIQTTTGRTPLFLLKDKTNSLMPLIISCRVQSNLASTISPIQLQIYNRTLNAWEILDTNNSSPADINFSLIGSKSINLSNYYDVNFWVACRVYQEPI